MLFELKVLRAKVQEVKARREVLSQYSGHLDAQIEKFSGRRLQEGLFTNPPVQRPYEPQWHMMGRLLPAR